LPLESQPEACAARGGNAGALDFNVKSASSEWGAFGQLTASQVVGGPPERLLRDGTLLQRGDAGWGTYVRAGRFGGDGLRFEGKYDFSSPTLELNAMGFQPTQNEQEVGAAVSYVRSNQWGPLKSFRARLAADAEWTTDGRALSREQNVNLSSELMLPSFDFLGMEAGVTLPGYDVREIAGTGIPLERYRHSYLVAFGETNPERLVSLHGFGALGFHSPLGVFEGGVGWTFELGTTFRPHPALETRVEIGTDRTHHGPRFLSAQADQLFFGTLRSEYLSFTLRQQWIISPRLSLQAYGQVFSAFGVFGPFFETTRSDRSPVLLSELTGTTPLFDPSFYQTALNVNLVLRWEYRLGSTLFLVYTRAQHGLPGPAIDPSPRTVVPVQLLRGPSTDALMLKWTYYWAV
jgi:hypothetical protein